MSYTLPRNLQPYAQRLPTLLNLLLIILIAFALARLFWLLWPVEQTYTPVTSIKSSPVSSPDSVEVDQIAAAYMFGQAEQKDAAALAAEALAGSSEVIDAPETQLNLILTGIVSSKSGYDSRALIKDEKNEQKPYAVGDTIINNVKLHAIYSNRVILDRSGRFETLTLEQEKQAEGAVTRSTSSNQVSPDVAQNLGAARNEILQNPSKAAQYLRIQPERRGGKLVGYRIYPGSDRSLFQNVGLRPGELVTAINGQTLDNPSESLKMLGDLSQAPSVSVTLERGGQTRTLEVSFQ